MLIATPQTSSSRRRPASARKSNRRAKATGSSAARSRKRTWCYADFVWFLGNLTLPTAPGEPLPLEPFWRFILKTIFRTGLVELLVLLPKGNGKTTILAALTVYHVLVTPNAECFIVAADREQADELYRFAQHFIEYDGLDKWLSVRASTRIIRSRRDQGFLRVLASDKTKEGGKKHSFNPTLAVIEELHAHENDNAYAAMRTAAFKRGGLVLDISTAGWNEHSTLGQLRAGMLKMDQEGGRVRKGMWIDKRGVLRGPGKNGRLTVAESRSGRNVMLEWSCRKSDDLADMKIVKLANPASFVTPGSLEDALEAPGITPWAFARYRANVWTLGFSSWLPPDAWELLGPRTFDATPYTDDTPLRRTCIAAPARLGVVDGDKAFAFVDMGRYRDSAAITVVAPRDNDDPVAWLAFVEKSGGRDAPIEYDPVKQACRDLDERYRMLAIGYDPKYFDQAASELKKDGLPMVEFPQSNERMCPAAANLRREIIAKRYRHDGDPILTAHVVAGATKDVGADEFKIVKGAANGPPIDALISLAGANQLAFFRPAKPKPTFEVLA